MPAVNDIIAKDPDVLGGTAVFRGTRVPFQALVDNLEGGQTLRLSHRHTLGSDRRSGVGQVATC
ncbi:MAG TPA: DUF433 domain-containing protein [Candidatus Acidoferrales bacterium]|nr:DUF433 domain-containing protein [Candidatus Acidoferrales bacterium]